MFVFRHALRYGSILFTAKYSTGRASSKAAGIDVAERIIVDIAVSIVVLSISGITDIGVWRKKTSDETIIDAPVHVNHLHRVEHRMTREAAAGRVGNRGIVRRRWTALPIASATISPRVETLTHLQGSGRIRDNGCTSQMILRHVVSVAVGPRGAVHLDHHSVRPNLVTVFRVPARRNDFFQKSTHIRGCL